MVIQVQFFSLRFWELPVEKESVPASAGRPKAKVLRKVLRFITVLTTNNHAKPMFHESTNLNFVAFWAQSFVSFFFFCPFFNSREIAFIRGHGFDQCSSAQISGKNGFDFGHVLLCRRFSNAFLNSRVFAFIRGPNGFDQFAATKWPASTREAPAPKATCAGLL